jgi:pimeloyl-ACP methyl ester carboxylesterase
LEPSSETQLKSSGLAFQAIEQEIAGEVLGNTYLADLAYDAQGQPVDSTLSSAAIGPDGKNYGGLFDLYSDPADASYRLDCNLPAAKLLDWFTDAATCEQSIYVYNAPPGQTAGLIPSLQAAGYTVSTFPYDWRGDITLLADNLATRIIGLAKQTPSGTVAIVAHSMGGLVVGEALYRHGAELNGLIQSITTLGAPWLGSVDTYSDFRAWDTILLNILTPQQTQEIGGNWTAAYELLPQQSFVSLIAGTPTVLSIYQGTFSSELPALPRAVGAYNALDGAVALWGNLAEVEPLGNAFTIVGSGYNTPISVVETTPGCLVGVYGNGDGEVTIGSATGGVWAAQGNTWYVLSSHAGLPANGAAIAAIEQILQGQVPNLSRAPFEAPGGVTNCLPL